MLWVYRHIHRECPSYLVSFTAFCCIIEARPYPRLAKSKSQLVFAGIYVSLYHRQVIDIEKSDGGVPSVPRVRRMFVVSRVYVHNYLSGNTCHGIIDPSSLLDIETRPEFF